MKFLFLLFSILYSVFSFCQNPWIIEAPNPNPDDYYGVTVANGMVGLVSSPEPLKVADVVLNGVYDNYQRGRVSNILKVFNHLNVNLYVDGLGPSEENLSSSQHRLR